MTASKYLALLAGAMLATGAVAGDKDHSMKSSDQKFDRLDSNQDSAISQTEAAKDENLAATFASVDADGDGQLSRTEFTAHLSDQNSQSSSDWNSSSESESQSDWSSTAGEE